MGCAAECQPTESSAGSRPAAAADLLSIGTLAGVVAWLLQLERPVLAQPGLCGTSWMTWTRRAGRLRLSVLPWLWTS